MSSSANLKLCVLMAVLILFIPSLIQGSQVSQKKINQLTKAIQDTQELINYWDNVYQDKNIIIMPFYLEKGNPLEPIFFPIPNEIFMKTAHHLLLEHYQKDGKKYDPKMIEEMIRDVKIASDRAKNEVIKKRVEEMETLKNELIAEREALYAKVSERKTEPTSTKASSDTKNLNGIYKIGTYKVTIKNATEDSVGYEGTDEKVFYHKGELTRDKNVKDEKTKVYKGTLEDAENGEIKDQGREANKFIIKFNTKQKIIELSINDVKWTPRPGKGNIGDIDGKGGKLVKIGELPTTK